MRKAPALGDIGMFNNSHSKFLVVEESMEGGYTFYTFLNLESGQYKTYSRTYIVLDLMWKAVA